MRCFPLINVYLCDRKMCVCVVCVFLMNVLVFPYVQYRAKELAQEMMAEQRGQGGAYIPAMPMVPPGVQWVMHPATGVYEPVELRPISPPTLHVRSHSMSRSPRSRSPRGSTFASTLLPPRAHSPRFLSHMPM